MPPTKRPARSAPARCAYKEGRQRCIRNTTGRSPYCRAHELVIQGEVAKAETKGSLADIAATALRDLFAGKKIDRDKIAQDLTDAIWESGGSFGEFRPDIGDLDWEKMFEQARARVGAARGGGGHHGQQRHPPPPAPDLEARRAIQQARATLGFGPTDVISKDMLKARHRELAKRHHPDKGGSLDRMQVINSAVDLIAGTI